MGTLPNSLTGPTTDPRRGAAQRRGEPAGGACTADPSWRGVHVDEARRIRVGEAARRSGSTLVRGAADARRRASGRGGLSGTAGARRKTEDLRSFVGVGFVLGAHLFLSTRGIPGIGLLFCIVLLETV